MKLRKEYKYTIRFAQPEHTYLLVGRHGAIHFHVLDLGKDYQHGDRYSGGLECHWRQPPEHMSDDVPSHEGCWVFGGASPCWHDGTSMYAHEVIIPFWLYDPQNHERMFDRLEQEYRRRFLIDA